MERQLPKNVRQIGNVSDNPKIYVEDYVDTFLSQISEKTTPEPQGAFLIGEIQSEEGQEYIYIYGAIRMHEIKRAGAEVTIGEQSWKNAYEDCKQYFEDGEMLGWYMTVPGGPITLNPEIIKLHKKSFPKKNSVLILEEPAEQEEAYYVNKYNDLMEIGGHYVYYEKNPCMQNYMISARKKNGVTPSETVEDRAAKDFRSLVRNREEHQEQKKLSRAMYAASVILMLVVVVMGVTTINNFDKMKTVQTSLESITAAAQNANDNTDADNTDADKTDADKTEPQKVSEEQEASAAQSENGQETAAEDNDDSNPAEGAAATEEVQAVMGSIALEESDQDSGNESSADTSQSAGSEGTGVNEMDAGSTVVSGTGVYVVESGDTLAIISQKSYGDVSHVDAICRMNGLTNGNLIYIGQKLLLP